jgi:hypothetical protein
LEQRPQGFTPHVLDERDGFLDALPADVDGDGRVDLITLLAQEHEQVLLWRNLAGESGPRFTAVVLFEAPHPAWGSSGIERVDLDGDGDQDLLLSNGDALDDDLLKPYHGVGWLRNEGAEKGAPRYVYERIADLPGCEQARAGDLDGDGDLDVVAVSFLPQLPPEVWAERRIPSVLWLERTADGWTPRPLEVGRCIHPSLALADWNLDGQLDIAVANWVWVDPGGAPRVQAEAFQLFTANPRRD